MEIRARYSLIAGGLVAGCVWVNALWLQEGRHPAPLFAAAPLPTSSAIAPESGAMPVLTPANAPLSAELQPLSAVLEAPAPVASAVVSPVPSTKRLTGERLAMLQGALFEMGFYDGPVDGIDGPRTHFAVLSYRKAHGLEATGAADEGLLAHARNANGEGLAVARSEPVSAEQRATAERRPRGPDSNSL